jgi:ABC-2 type transport system permease protein
MRLAWAFLKRDATMAMSYRISFAVQLLGNILILGLIYFIGKSIGPQPLATFQSYGGSFLGFLLIGVALTDCAGVSLTTFAREIREGQLSGTLEATLMSPVRLPVMLIYSSLWNYCFSAFRFLLYLVVGSVLYGVSLGKANVPASIILFFLTILCFMGIGILWSSVVMVVKRGDAIITSFGFVVLLLGGVLFPSNVLPSWLQTAAELIPLKHALEGMRLALLTGADLRTLAPIVVKLAIFVGVLLPGGLFAFSMAVESAKRNGSLTEF